ncbi:MAG TPA: 1-deoxy-D-xylulose-5-phosphate synthase [Clostridiales bacterium]|nr:1-deoxy-D-xylulose-5-phosphate synthase [Clostridiales bacterium]
MSPEAIRQMTDQQARQLSEQLREQIIDSVSKTGGHLASSLGVVELTVAIHRVFDLNIDRLVFDVGHQCYAHKILTGRGGQMHTLRQFGGLSGFPKPNEHRADAFVAGHASNSVSVALGMARARTVNREDYSVLAIIGDGAMTGGLSFEGLSNAGQSGEPLIVILNDNGMSITKNVGGVASHLARQRLKPQYLHMKKLYRRLTNHGKIGRTIYHITHRVKKMVKDAVLAGSVFEDMGFEYIGPVEGHDVARLTQMLHYAKELHCPVLLHVRTVKGKGYPPAEREPDKFHGVGPFDRESGAALSKSGGVSFSSVFGETMVELAQQNPEVCAITAAMQPGTGLDGFAQRFPERFYDVGIAEEHAVCMAAGMAKQRTIPVFAVYSSFLQRAYDMLIHDVAIQGLHTVFGVDRAGLVGEDGETHHGVFDVAYLSSVPGMKIYAPANYEELRQMLRRAVLEESGPVAVRYPRGTEGALTTLCGVEGACELRPGRQITLVGYGTTVNTLLEAAEQLEAVGVSAQVLKLNSILPLDTDTLCRCARDTGRMMVVEECVDNGCVGHRIAAALMGCGLGGTKLTLVNLGNRFVPHGTVAQLRTLCGLDAKALVQRAMEEVAHG